MHKRILPTIVLACLLSLSSTILQAQLSSDGKNKGAYNAFRAAEKKFYKGNFKGGEASFERAARRYENNGESNGYIAAKAMEALILLNKDRPKDAFQAFKKAEELYNAQGQHNQATRAYLRLCLGKYHLYYNENKEASTFLKEAYTVSNKNPEYFSPIFEMQLQQTLGELYLREGDEKTALEFFDELLQTSKKIPEEEQNKELLRKQREKAADLSEKVLNPKEAAERYASLLKDAEEEIKGELNFKTGRSLYKYTEYESAYDHLTEALTQDLTEAQRAETKAMLATIAMSIKDYDDALVQNGTALALQLKIGSDPQTLYNSFVKQGNIYKELETNGNSTYWYKKTVNPLESNWQLSGELNKYQLEQIEYKESVAKEENFNLALLSYERAERLVKKLNKTEQKPALVEVYMAKGSLYFSARATEQAAIYYDKALEIMSEIYPEKHPLVAEAARFQCEIAVKNGQLKLALEWINRSINAATTDKARSVTGENFPIADQAEYPYELLYSTAIKSSVLYLIYQKQGAATQAQLEHSLKGSDLAFSMLVKLRASYRTEGAKYELPALSQLISYQAIQTTSVLHDLMPDKRHLHRLFKYIENSKSALLLEAVQQLRAKAVANVPASVVEKESTLKTEIAYLSGEIYYEARKGQNMDKIRLQALKNALKEAKKAYPEYLTFLEQNYPDYYAMKYAQQPVPCQDLQARMSEEDIVVNYAVVDSLVHLLYVDNNQLIYAKRPIQVRLRSVVARYISSLKGEEPRDFVRYSNLWYRLLIQPIEDQLDGRALVVIPDAELNYLPFELIPTTDIAQDFSTGDQDNYNRYKEVPYLLRQMPVAYNYSATLYLEAHEHNYSNVPERFMGFAPDFSKIEEFELGRRQEASRYQDMLLTPLDNAALEIKRIGELTKGDTYLGAAATESQFKQEAASYGVLHFATHGILNHKYPLYSSLVLLGDEQNDGLLHTYELYNMELNAELVALSACNTGVGTIKKGEGAMSVARGFAFAGCPNIAMTLWPISDQATQVLMENFYIYLMQGYPKAEALRKAKLSFLDTGEGLICVPYFWSGLILVGTPAPMHSLQTLSTSWGSTLWALILGGSILLIIIGFIIIKKRAV